MVCFPHKNDKLHSKDFRNYSTSLRRMKGKKVNFTLEESMKAQRGGIEVYL
jgi:hypothetical protein